MKPPIMDSDYEELFNSILESSPYFLTFKDSFEADGFTEDYGHLFSMHQLDHFLFFKDENEYLAAIILM